MENDVLQLVQAVHNQPSRVMLVAAGAGTQALAWLLGVAGASRTLLEATIPYSESSFNTFLGHLPRQFVSAETASLLAGRALNRASWLYEGEESLVGLSCTATVVTDRPKRGQHRAHVATWTKDRVINYHLHLHKGQRDRYGEENLVSRLMLNALAEAFNLDQRLVLPLVEGDTLTRESQDISNAAEHLYRGESDYIVIQPEGHIDTAVSTSAILAGSFNPLHRGHLVLTELASELLGLPITFELTAVNADKPAIDQEEALRRLIQFAGRYPIIVSNAPTFVSKAQLFPGTTFIVGYDTAKRILETRFYDNSYKQLQTALSDIQNQGCSFLVAGRVDDHGTFFEATELEVPEPFRKMFQFMPPGRFRLDISSTELRRIKVSGYSPTWPDSNNFS
jgi:hypothetical protein